MNLLQNIVDGWVVDKPPEPLTMMVNLWYYFGTTYEKMGSGAIADQRVVLERENGEFDKFHQRINKRISKQRLREPKSCRAFRFSFRYE